MNIFLLRHIKPLDFKRERNVEERDKVCAYVGKEAHLAFPNQE
jgi:hypothetical protein